MTRSAEPNRKSFPDKEARQKCWDSRDEYWACLDKNKGTVLYFLKLLDYIFRFHVKLHHYVKTKFENLAC